VPPLDSGHREWRLPLDSYMRDLEHRDEQDAASSNTLSSARLIHIAKTQGLRLLAGVLIGGALGYAVAMVLPKQWQATATLLLGQIYDGKTTVQLDPPVRAIERLRLRSLHERVLRRLGLDPLGEAGKLFFSTAGAKTVRGSDLIEISANGYSPEQAKQFLSGLQDEFVTQHQRIFESASKRLTDNLVETEQLLAQAEARRVRLIDAASSSVAKNRSNATSSTNLFISELLNSNAEEIGRIRREKNDLLEQLNPQRTFNTRPLGAIIVSESPVFPKTGIAILAGALLGLAAALITVLWIQARTESQPE